MKRRLVFSIMAVAASVGLAALRSHNEPGLLILDGAAGARAETPPVAFPVELGLNHSPPSPVVGSPRACRRPGRAPACRGPWTDPKPAEGRHHYYVRVQQVDGELAWSSPLWIEYAP